MLASRSLDIAGARFKHGIKHDKNNNYEKGNKTEKSFFTSIPTKKKSLFLHNDVQLFLGFVVYFMRSLQPTLVNDRK